MVYKQANGHFYTVTTFLWYVFVMILPCYISDAATMVETSLFFGTSYSPHIL